ncbi:MAG: galactokinase [Clostridia bacterium]|nr:galactokinase [Clostridia bacterium]
MPALNEVRRLLRERALDDSFAAAYTPELFDRQYTRFAAVTDDFAERFDPSGNRDVHLFSAPGRTEVGGNHTDHNHGKVLAASISLDVVGAAAKNDEFTVRIKSAGYPMDVVDCGDLSVHDADAGRSVSLVRGILAGFAQRGYKVGGFDAATASMVLSGSGLSSSAAFEILVGTILNELYNDGAVSPVELARIAQYAENVHFKKPCGLLDQMACSVGGFVKIDFADPAAPVVERVNFDFASCGHSLCIIDTLGSHSDLTDDYAAIRSEMEAVAAYFGKTVLREVTKQQVLDNAAALAKAISERAVLRALHFFGENERVEREFDALSAGDFETFKATVIESGRSSYQYNQNVFTSRYPTKQPLSLALAVSEDLLKGRGAWRVHGGGFAGTIQAFVPNDLLADYLAAMRALFNQDACYVLSVRPVGGKQFI